MKESSNTCVGGRSKISFAKFNLICNLFYSFLEPQNMLAIKKIFTFYVEEK